MTPAVLSAAALSTVLFFVAPLASANGRFPASNQIVFSSSDPSLIVVRTTYGILPTRDNGTTWGFLCENALGLQSTAYQDPELGLTLSNALVAGVQAPPAGLDVSTDFGCDWSCVVGPLSSQSIADVVVRPDAPSVVLALTSTYLPQDAGGGTFSQVFQSADDGAHWTALGVPLDPSFLVQTIDVAKADPQRIYVSGSRGFGANRTASLFVSTDGAAHWTERSLPQFDTGTEDNIYIGGVDPLDSDRVYVRSSALITYDPSTGAALTGGQSRLFVTTDAAQSFQVIEEFAPTPPSNVTNSGELLGFALSPDGSKIYAGTKEAGLFVATRADMTFRKTSSIHVQCLATRGSELWACSDAVSGFIVGVSNDDGATFDAKMVSITSLAGPIACGSYAGGPLACGATVSGSQCAEPFDAFCQSFAPGTGCHSDAIDAGGGRNASRGPSISPSGGCSAGGSKGAAGLAVFSAFAAITLRRKCRSASRKR